MKFTRQEKEKKTMDIVNQNKDRRDKRKSSVDLSTMVYGKIPPQAREIEEDILGAVLLEKNAFDRVIDIIKPECFYVDAHQRIFRCCQALAQKSMPIDIRTVVEQLKADEQLEEIGGPYYVTKLTNAVKSSANLETYCRIVFQKFIQRELIRISGEIIQEAYEDSADPFDLMDETEKKLSGIMLSTTKKPYNPLDIVVEKVLQKVASLRNRQGSITGVPTGIMQLDQITRGWQPTDLIILAARPSIGKSAIAANFARNAASHEEMPTKVGIFSLEMSDAQWAMRILSAESEIDKNKINRAALDDKEMDSLIRLIPKKIMRSIFIDDTAGINIYQFKTKARRMVLQEKVGLIIVDYLQLMSGTNERSQNREQEISTISRNLKALAKELNVPIIALSQLSRDVEKRGGSKKPQLSDLRESGAIEQDADVVIFLTPVDETEVAKDASLRDSIFLGLAKHRDGALDAIEVKFAKDIQKIMSRVDYENYMTRMGMYSRGFVPVNAVDFTQSKASLEDDNKSDDLPF
jgi:replicative DNA helicase